MKDLKSVKHFEPLSKIVDILCEKTQNTDRLFFNVMVSYYFAKVASMMRTNIRTHDRGLIPVNLYALNLANSGFGKGLSTNIVEEKVIHKFKQNFMEDAFPAEAATHLAKLANKRSLKNVTDAADELAGLQKEFEMAGNMLFGFNSATTAAVKQMRHKLLLANIGSISLEIDEIGSNLLSNVDVLTTFLEVYDVGIIKQKLTKNTLENSRGQEIDGRTPANMMLFGTPSKLLSGGKIEEELDSMLETGYARRFLFGYALDNKKIPDMTPEEIYDQAMNSPTDAYLDTFSDHVGQLADPSCYNRTLKLSKDVSLIYIEYKMTCDRNALKFSDHQEIKKAELSHRYFKALKLAGAFAFIDNATEITTDHMYQAIKLVEESGEAFDRLLTKERNYVKLAKYIATVGREVTHADIVEDLPFYRGGENAKRELMNLAIAYGIKNNIIIKKSFIDGIEFFSGECLEENDTKECILSMSRELAYNYEPQLIGFEKLHKLTQTAEYNWVSHHLIDKHRNEVNCVPKFNLVVLDIDGGTPLSKVKMLLSDYKYLIHTTKSHTESVNRFRVILPVSHNLKMSAIEFKEFMNNIYEWLPFELDDGTNQRSRKWATHPGEYSYNEGELLNALLFIPKTTKNEERKKIYHNQQSLTNLERWFVNKTGIGNRSKQLIKYALLLVDSGYTVENVHNSVNQLNDKLADKLMPAEISNTIMITVAKAVAKRDI